LAVKKIAVLYLEKGIKTYKWGVKQRVLLLSLVPTITICVLIGVYFTGIRLQDINQALSNRGLAIAKRLAPSAEYGVLIRSKNILRELASKGIEEDEVCGIAFYDKDSKPITTLGNSVKNLSTHMYLKNSKGNIRVMRGSNVVSFILPVINKAGLDDNNLEDSYLSKIEENDDTKIYGWIQVDLERTNTRLEEQKIYFHSFIIMLFGLLTSTLVAMRMGNSISIPILELARGVEEVKKGNLDIKIISNAEWEIKELESGINIMASSLNAARSELQNKIEQATADLRHTLETIEIQNIELEISRKEAETASQVKSEFLANMSHEVRTPLNGIIGFINLLNKTELKPRQKDFLVTIQKSANSLLEIINDILDFSKIEAGKLTIELAPMDIRECIEDALTLLAPAAHEKAIELIPFFYDDVPDIIIGDELRIRQVVTNLVSNAIKFTEQGSVIVRIMLDRTMDKEVTLRISVTDTGIGLSKEQQKKLFNAFNQVSKEARKRYGGTGLGLVICKKLVEQMHGRIDLESEIGKGSTFWFTLKTTVQTNKDDLANKENNLFGMRILLYERHPVMRLVLLHLLRKWQVEVEEIDHPDNIVPSLDAAKANGETYHLTLLGVNQLNKQDTFVADIVTSVRGHDRHPIGILVNTTDHFLHTEILQYGAYLCLAKPVCRKKLFRALYECYYKKEPQKLALIKGSNPMQQNIMDVTALAVDDNPANLKLVCALLDEIGVQSVGVSSGIDAIKKCKLQTFNIIIMDIQMPEMDGVEATKAIRELEKDRAKTPIVALSAHAMINNSDSLLDAGFNDFLTKPVSERELKATIYKWTYSGVAPTQTKITSIESQPTKTKAIDWKLCLSLSSGKEKLAKDMLEMFLGSLADELSKIKQAHADNDLAEMESLVHKLHGGCCYCGVPKLKQLVKSAEDMLRSSNISKLEEQMELVYLESTEVLAEGKDYLLAKEELV